MVSFTLQVTYPLGEKTPSVNLIGGWVDPRAGLEAVAKRKIPTISTAGNPMSVVQPVG